jgi:hypothetical protein
MGLPATGVVGAGVGAPVISPLGDGGIGNGGVVGGIGDTVPVDGTPDGAGGGGSNFFAGGGGTINDNDIRPGRLSLSSY